MKFDAATLFLLFALSVATIEVACNESDEDTSIIDAAVLGSDEDGVFPNFDNNNLIQCRETEEYSRCNANPDCQRNCFNLQQDGIPCPRSPITRSCIEGCVCKKNYVRSELYGGCIPVDQCNRVRH